MWAETYLHWRPSSAVCKPVLVGRCPELWSSTAQEFYSRLLLSAIHACLYIAAVVPDSLMMMNDSSGIQLQQNCLWSVVCLDVFASGWEKAYLGVGERVSFGVHSLACHIYLRLTGWSQPPYEKELSAMSFPFLLVSEDVPERRYVDCARDIRQNHVRQFRHGAKGENSMLVLERILPMTRCIELGESYQRDCWLDIGLSCCLECCSDQIALAPSNRR